MGAATPRGFGEHGVRTAAFREPILRLLRRPLCGRNAVRADSDKAAQIKAARAKAVGAAGAGVKAAEEGDHAIKGAICPLRSTLHRVPIRRAPLENPPA